MAQINGLEQTAEQAHALMAEMRLQFETMTQIQSEERREIDKRHKEDMSAVRKHYGKIIAGLIIALVVLISGIFGGAVYLLANFDFAVVSTQTVDNNSINYDGININTK